MRQKGLAGTIGKWSWILIVAFLGIGWKYPVIGSIALVCMLAPAITAAWKGGRIWCGSFCPRGSFNDNLLSKISRSIEIPKFIRTVWFRIGFALFLVYNFVVGIINAQGDLIKIGFVFYKIILITSIITVILGIMYHERTWCSFCPMGSLSALITKIRRRWFEQDKRIIVNENTCVDCSVCAKDCPMDLKPHDFVKSNDKDLDCIHCEKCVYNCPVDALTRN
ncbi:4Fe-4S binding protein [Acetohalobium arabaticum]|uniref:4Fe-4S ferredoxin iron-sulfur binding domain protein n=1 Tax=Acetohalobium arabaticum (strain ATCC 49924 / DSM 5501 / Z-7288) TaxID=574087 RepID=D9QUR0_ACEAZ|nr:4Fe-4S binding protein [Acetohalobium arabaticum]ADL11969.1 4Fe-4S ferredoxin iron-sulfur binding domain protein [Acetohalobium arabaticum DSM 5501]